MVTSRRNISTPIIGELQNTDVNSDNTFSKAFKSCREWHHSYYEECELTNNPITVFLYSLFRTETSTFSYRDKPNTEKWSVQFNNRAISSSEVNSESAPLVDGTPGLQSADEPGALSKDEGIHNSYFLKYFKLFWWTTHEKIIKQIMKQEKKDRERVREILKLNHLFPNASKKLRMSEKLEEAGKRK